MAKISHHGSCRSKSSTEFKCICFEKGNRWDGKCQSRQCETYEIRQSIYWSGNKTAMYKSPEDNQVPGLFTCESFTTQNPKFIKICHQMWGTGQDGRKRNKKRTSATRNHCCQNNLHTIQSVRFNHQRTNHSKKDQYWIPEKKKHDSTFQTLKDVFNARNLDIPRIHVKVKLFVLDVVKKDTIKMTAKTIQNAKIV